MTVSLLPLQAGAGFGRLPGLPGQFFRGGADRAWPGAAAPFAAPMVMHKSPGAAQWAQATLTARGEQQAEGGALV
ncbi:MAG: hypothetical protein M3Q65_21340 [Chloroflexota bacterium]|nr:hypothetical protein [Chloroflexota bacterium]